MKSKLNLDIGKIVKVFIKCCFLCRFRSAQLIHIQLKMISHIQTFISFFLFYKQTRYKMEAKFGYPCQEVED